MKTPEEPKQKNPPSTPFDGVLKRMLETPPDPKVKPQPEKTKPAK